jgi:methionine-S-sulfoxide reductase
VEALYRAVDGVIGTEVGYTGGHVPDATYKQVCSGTTGHAEAVHVTYDPERVDYQQLLDIFWENHDPTQANGQGVNLGSQYRSGIFFHTESQREIAEAAISALAATGRYSKPIATGIHPAEDFVRAEDYHQQYYEKQGFVPRR